MPRKLKAKVRWPDLRTPPETWSNAELRGVSINPVVTGVSRGLGRALVDGFIARGHMVFGCARSPDAIADLRRRYPPPNGFAVVDVSRDDEVRAWAAEVLPGGPPDLLVNNAGAINRNAPLWKVPADEFSHVVDVNVKGVANVIRHFLPAMIERGRGVVVNFSSWWGREGAAEVAPVLRHEVGDRRADPGDGGGTAQGPGCRARDPRGHRHGNAAKLLRGRGRKVSRPGGLGREGGAVPSRARAQGQRQAAGSAGVRRKEPGTDGSDDRRGRSGLAAGADGDTDPDAEPGFDWGTGRLVGCADTLGRSLTRHHPPPLLP